MQEVFTDIAKDIYKTNPNIHAAFVMMNGWLGQHEHKHTNGIITSLDLPKIFSENKLNIQGQVARIQ